MMVIYAKYEPTKLVKNNKHSLLNKKLQECIQKNKQKFNKKELRQSFEETHITIGEMQCLEEVLIDYFIKTINNKQRFKDVSKHDDMDKQPQKDSRPKLWVRVNAHSTWGSCSVFACLPNHGIIYP